MGRALPGGHYCATHQGNHSHYAEENCELCKAYRERDEARAALRMIADGDLYNADGMRTIACKALAATEAKP